MQVNPAANGNANVPPPKVRAESKDSAPPVPQAAPVDPPERARGVIRLLQEGHFKGVADVRLRINFAEEIAALQSNANARAAGAGPAPIIEAADAVIEEFLAGNEVDPETVQQLEVARDAFAASLQNIFDSFAGTPNAAAQSLLDSLSAAIDEFLAAVEALVPADVPEPVGGEEPAVESTEAPTVDGALALGQLVEKLREALQAAVDGLQSQFDAAEVLPPLSSPSGNGRAYEKFLAILNGLYDQQSGSVDTAA